MNGIEPVVRHMLLCDDVQPNPVNPHKANIYGLVSNIQSEPDAVFPLVYPQLAVYLLMSDGRGTGQGRIVVVHADSDQPVFLSPSHPIMLGNDPLAVRGVVFRLQDCAFPSPGLYWVEFRYNNKKIAQQPLLVK